MSQLAIPNGPEEITPEWFTVVLRENTITTSETVVGIQAEIIGQDWGFTGVIARVHLQYADHAKAGYPASVVVKFPTATHGTPSAYRAAHSQDVTAARRYFDRCAREVLFYQKIASLNHISVPRLYYGATDDMAGRVILVLEDLHSARLGDALHGCSAPDATLVIDQLAHFHAQWWNYPQRETFSWLPLWGGDSQIAQNRYIQCLGPFLQRFGARVPRPILEVIDALATNYGAVRSRLQLSPVTMIHGDLHLDNILFSPPGHEAGMRVIDWQSVARGRGAIDLALFLFGTLSLETSARRAVEGDLLRRYHELLLAGGVMGYGFPQLMEDCRLVLLWLLGAKVVWLGSIDMESLSGRELALADAGLTEDSFADILDYDVGSLL